MRYYASVIGKFMISINKYYGVYSKCDYSKETGRPIVLPAKLFPSLMVNNFH